MRLVSIGNQTVEADIRPVWTARKMVSRISEVEIWLVPVASSVILLMVA